MIVLKFLAVISRVLGEEDYIICVTETLIRNAAQGRDLALRVQEATGGTVPLNQIVFWRHASDEDLSGKEIQYRLIYMDVLTECAM